ncbi:MAG: malate dehydrogenase [Candidatus Portnoybacteria bacterium RIFCSPLOWO2_02_FULL_39_11]|uniref:Malate dehydrogenase n=1 Tax=Candidatus Portnoybacteria bacterium RIFCSPLOWO2_02_FULL_39_11 TaxID=1802001 RepID=A0A1G2FUQ2_9BACT|nr:MAG: malate dehydrogenase [Candidatus Portnoybacteria bacterium RIFCSPLOWO2_02_FULL_39_11]
MTKQNLIGQKAIARHKKLNGKISVVSKVPVKTAKDLSIYYTPGVGAVASYLAGHKDQVRNFTVKRNTVAVVSDGSAVLGLGNIGPEGAIPVMEGKCQLFKVFANVDAFPIILDTQDVNEIVATVKHISPVFGGINLEDISAPRCFEIEKRLIDELDIPVMHDDQHGTAIVVLAAIINAMKVVKKTLQKSKIVIAGAGAAGIAVTKLLLLENAGDVILVDSQAIISRDRKDMNGFKNAIAKITNKNNISGSLQEAIKGADVLIGLAKAGLFKPEHIKSMNERPIVFAMANPVPEIMPAVATKAGAVVVATGRSDFPNQINNVLGFPGIFRGALDNNVKKITPAMKLRAAKNLAALIKKPTADYIIPSPFDKRVVKAVARAIKE